MGPRAPPCGRRLLRMLPPRWRQRRSRCASPEPPAIHSILHPQFCTFYHSLQAMSVAPAATSGVQRAPCAGGAAARPAIRAHPCVQRRSNRVAAAASTEVGGGPAASPGAPAHSLHTIAPARVHIKSITERGAHWGLPKLPTLAHSHPRPPPQVVPAAAAAVAPAVLPGTPAPGAFPFSAERLIEMAKQVGGGNGCCP